MTMTRQDQGFATVAVTALLGALSVVAIAYLQLSLTQARKARLLADQVKIDLALAGALAQTLALIQNGNLTASPTGLRRPIRFDNVTYQLALSFEYRRTRATKESLLSFADEQAHRFNGETERAAYLNRVRTLTEEELEAPDFGWAEAVLARDTLSCLRGSRTVFAPTGTSALREDGMGPIPDGHFIRLVLEPQMGKARGLDVVVLKTGRRDQPFWVMSWRRYSGRETFSCG